MGRENRGRCIGRTIRSVTLGESGGKLEQDRERLGK